MSKFADIEQKLARDENASHREKLGACKELLNTAAGRKWLEVARKHFEVDAPRFRKDDPSHDAALIRDGQAEVIYWTVAMAELAGDDD